MIHGFGDWYRTLEGLSSALVLGMLTWRVLRVYRKYHWTQKMIFAALICYNIQQVGRAYVIVTQTNAAWSFWLVFGLLANTIMVAYLWEPRDEYQKRLGQDVRHP